MDDFLSAEERYINLKNVLTELYQSDTIEKQFIKYLQMSGGRFLVNLSEVNAFEKHSNRKISK